jgi:transcription antitermination factor NusG
VTHRAKLYFGGPTLGLPLAKTRELEMPAAETSESGILDTSSWWAVYTRHHHEKVIADMLTAKGFKVFLPLYESIRRWKDRRKVLSLPLFPCYIFIRGGLDRKLQVVTTPGIHMILYRGQKVAVIPDQEIEAIQKAVDGPCRVEPHPFLKCGTRVRVKMGALEGVEGILIRKKNLSRLILSVDMLAQSVSVEVHASDVEPCAAASQEVEMRSSSFFFTGQNRIQSGNSLRASAP